jgi:hypothetical protein
MVNRDIAVEGKDNQWETGKSTWALEMGGR